MITLWFCDPVSTNPFEMVVNSAVRLLVGSPSMVLVSGDQYLYLNNGHVAEIHRAMTLAHRWGKNHKSVHFQVEAPPIVKPFPDITWRDMVGAGGYNCAEFACSQLIAAGATNLPMISTPRRLMKWLEVNNIEWSKK